MNTPTQLFFGGSDDYNGDYSKIHRRAKLEQSEEWEVMKNTRKGDRVLIYFNEPHSAIVASGVALDDAWSPKKRSFRGRIGKIKILRDPITFDELKTLFPGWAWLKYPRSKLYLDSAQAAKLWKRAEGQSSHGYRRWRNIGAGFGDPDSNRQVEKAAVNRVCRILKRKGYSVVSREAEHVGYDLEAKRGSRVLHVEVKGVSGTELKFPITSGELTRAKEDPNFRLYVVTRAREKSARVRSFTGPKVIAGFTFKTISYLASHA